MLAPSRHRIPLFALFALIGAAVLLGFGILVRAHVRAEQGDAAMPLIENPVASVRVTTVARHHLPLRAQFHGFLEPWIELTVAARISGEVVEQWVEISDEVEVAQPLFKVDHTVREIAHEQALSVQERADSEFHSAEADWRRMESLPEQTSSSTERIKAEMLYRAAKADKCNAAAAVRLAAVMLERTTVVSPIDGVVSRIHLRRGEFIQQGMPLADVIEVDRLKLIAQVNDRDVVWIEAGHSVTLTTDTFPGEQFEGTVVRIYPQSLPTSRKFEVEIAVPNPTSRHLRPGLFMTGVIETDSNSASIGPSSLLLVPREAVVERFGQHFCYVLQGGMDSGAPEAILEARRTAVEIRPIPTDPRSYQIVSGVAEGSLVVTKGHQHLAEHALVRITD